MSIQECLVNFQVETYTIETIGDGTKWAFVRDFKSNMLYLPLLPTLVPMFPSSRIFTTHLSHYKDKLGLTYKSTISEDVGHFVRSQSPSFYLDLWHDQNKVLSTHSSFYKLDTVIDFYKTTYTFMDSPYNTKTVYNALVKELEDIKNCLRDPMQPKKKKMKVRVRDKKKQQKKRKAPESSEEEPEDAALILYMSSARWQSVKARKEKELQEDMDKMRTEFREDIEKERAAFRAQAEKTIDEHLKKPETEDAMYERYTRTHKTAMEEALRKQCAEEMESNPDFKKRILDAMGYTEEALKQEAVAERRNDPEVIQRAIVESRKDPEVIQRAIELYMDTTPAPPKKQCIEEDPQNSRIESSIPSVEAFVIE